ncbi:cache domain-containing protein [Xenorhabdus szentirmaii]|uniref:Cache domain-containing protein n=1 Tax=Xenorhabdus szentirmaii DSM 16338 TaxID=1427518 RepID=W1ITX8_9GAMM|nr:MULTISPECIES: cache domain-containing protein [Xenorhabdus]MBD2794159.1 hypothetical protein [Xenorhabdus sp. CUL]MBD2805974.1 hypothetical protein [Xenorhabdus sp. ZM]MBD2822855.1 hypothetical protein [Xenorhabdus sp. 42]MBD2823407.1 hypothetical protein [Xenorhabdus sp. 5]PHM32642.1 hypothetical protein Xsze_03389 [Xenorhabdus szentirmaii DSM 16338]
MHTDVFIEQVKDTLEGIMDNAARSAAGLAEFVVNILHQQPRTSVGTLTVEQRQALQNGIRDCLNATPFCNGAGFASHAQSGDEPGYWTLEWWFKDGHHIHPLQLERSQETCQRLDFRTFDWFDQPACRHRPYIEGPYVDYVCNGDYTITASHPVMIGKMFVGVAAVDVLVSTLERQLQPVLSALGRPALIVNSQGRVVISTTPRIHTGALWSDMDTVVAAHALRLVFPQTVSRQIHSSSIPYYHHQGSHS